MGDKNKQQYYEFVNHVVHVETEWTREHAKAWAATYEEKYEEPCCAEQLYHDGWAVIEKLDY